VGSVCVSADARQPASTADGTRTDAYLAPRVGPRVADADSGDGLHSAIRDQVVVTYFPAPHSYTGEHVVEISAHGSPVVLESILRSAVTAGARLAEPGEFTLRAFLNGKLDLVQAEAVRDLIEAVTPLQARAAFDQLEGTLTTRIGAIERALFDLMARLEASLDFPDEGYHFVEREHAAREVAALHGEIDRLTGDARRGRMIREGAQIAILGTPNVGKSSLFNALLNANRAIVTPVPGTTRDVLTERADVRGIAVSLVDTAGIRESADVVEREGISRARQSAAVADLALLVLDRSRPLTADDRALLTTPTAAPRVVVVNKIDLPPAWSEAALDVDASAQPVAISVKTGSGLDALLDRMAAAIGAGPERRDPPLVSNVRHIERLQAARSALVRAGVALGATDPADPSAAVHAATAGNAANAADAGVSEEFVLADLQEAAAALQEITGKRTTEDLLAHIFARFCIGK
jgi:tRNA modification GTPase